LLKLGKLPLTKSNSDSNSGSSSRKASIDKAPQPQISAFEINKDSTPICFDDFPDVPSHAVGSEEDDF
jgi:hypothetical protein